MHVSDHEKVLYINDAGRKMEAQSRSLLVVPSTYADVLSQLLVRNYRY